MATKVDNVTETKITLGDYKNLNIKRPLAQVTEEDIANAREKLRQDNREEMRLIQRPVEKGDTVKIDFEGFINGEAFEGGRGDNYDLEIGSGAFIEGFEDQIIGASVGDKIEVNVRFPENYGGADIAGKDAVFKVTVKEIKCTVTPDFGLPLVIVATGFDSIEAFEEDAKIRIAAQKQEKLDVNWQNELLAAVIEKSEITLPQSAVEKEAESLFEEYTNSLGKDGVSIEAYLEYVGLSGQQFLDQIKLDAKRRLECQAVLEAIGKAENITVSDDELQQEMQRAADASHRLLVELERMMTDEHREMFKKDILMQKAMRMLMKANM